MDVSGQRFGKLTVLRCLDEKPNYNSEFVCRCDCGNEIILHRYLLFRGRTSCGCDRIRDDLTGKRFGKLTVEGLVKKDKFFFATTWKCRCDCGNEVTYPTIMLRNELVSSCGCDNSEGALNGADLAKANRGEIEGTNTFQLQSALNGVLYESNKTGVRGVYLSTKDQRYWAVITFQGKRINIGQYRDLNSAAQARENAEQLLYGQFLDYYETELKSTIEAGNKQAVADIIQEATENNNTLVDMHSEDPIEATPEPGMCWICGNPLPPGRQKYCSEKCAYTASLRRNKARNEKKKGYCEICGKPVPTDRRRYCSDTCEALGISIMRKPYGKRGLADGKYEIICADCGKKAVVASYKSYRCRDCQEKARKLQNAASKARAKEGKTRKIGSTVICEKCGKEYIVKGASQRYCDICGAIVNFELVRENMKKKKHKVNERTVVCQVCGKEFISYARNLPKCCSPECKAEYKHQYNVRYWSEHGKNKEETGTVVEGIKEQ